MPASHSWSAAFGRALLSGSAASVASALALAWRGKHELDDPVAPLNGPSQWIWGKGAPYQDGFSARHTVVGYAIHHLASVFWALFYEKARPQDRNPVAPAALAAAVSSFVDYRLTPERLTPGFEKRLSRKSLVLVYAAFGLGLALPSLIGRARAR